MRVCTLKLKQNFPKPTLTLIWVYLQMIGTPVERLLAEEDLWTLDRDDLEKAYLILKFEKTTRSPSALEMRKLISQLSSKEGQLSKWLNNIYKKVVIYESLN